MLRSMYSGVAGMKGFQTKLDVIGNNIANVNTVGFKKSRVMFQDILSQTTKGVTAPSDTSGGVNAQQVGLGSRVSSIDTMHLAGSAQTTNNPTDLRIDGDGFFAVKLSADQEVPYLTRAGDFHVDSARNLVTSDGGFVVDTDGTQITVPDTAVSFSIQANGTMLVTNADGTTAAGQTIGVAKVVNPAGLEKIGGSLYRVTPNAVPDGDLGGLVAPGDATAGTGSIVAGQLEMSNVDLTDEFTEMIVAQRGFQANSRIITTSDDILQELLSLKR
ncbi:flagellar basal body rod protein FlgG [Paenibacillus wenxiniae]|uniref:Flagellar basal body rod protein FlgG n=1 Tax=Paenibacillus wenxiniae TaxID=1636843 RepID=A0ABW4RQD0_9BACL